MPIESKYIIASRLAKYLRIHGSKVTNGSCKLSLATSALCLLNTLFVEVLNEEWPGTLNISASTAEDITLDVKFLYDFMKAISSLKLFHQVQTLRGGVDLSHFSNLTVLELRKMPAHLIIGLDCLSVQLKALICSRSIYLLKEIFDTSVNEQNDQIVWTELKELNLSYNYLESLDHSLRSIPFVEVIDLSHNHIKNADEIQTLKMLNFVNLSYNELEHLPVFHIASCRSLTKLYVRSNNLEDLDGLDCLFNLEELDVGYNLLTEYHVLNPLDKLKSLRVLNFEGNPLYFHSRHQILVAYYINPIVLSRGLQLNGKLLSVPLNMPPSVNAEANRDSHHQTSINTVVGNAESTMFQGNAVYIPSNLDHITRSIGDISERSSFEDNSVSSLTSQSGAEQMATLSQELGKKTHRRKSKAGKKVKKMREVLINDNDGQNFDEVSTAVKATGSKETSVPSHMKTKELLEARRLERGETWLMPDNSFQRIMVPTLQAPANTPISSYPGVQALSQKDFVSKVNSSFASVNNQSSDTAETFVTSSPILKEMAQILDIGVESNSVDLKGQVSNENDDIEVLSTNCNDDDNGNLQVIPCKRESSEFDIYGSNADDDENLEQIEELESEEESEDSIFFVERRDDSKRQAVSVNIGPNYIKEKDVISAKVLERLDLNVLQSVQSISIEENDCKCCEVHLEFDTRKASKQKRIYIFDDLESAKVVSRILQPFADAKTLKEVTLGALECLKCNAQFSKQVANKILLKTKKPLGKEIPSSSYDSEKEYPQEVDACPNCGSHILVEMDSFPMPAMGTSPCSSRKKASDKSPDNVSVGSPSSGNLLSSLFSSMKISPILKRKPVSESQNSASQKVGEPNKTLESDVKQSSDSKTYTTGSYMSRNSSDITIISNPSQSSITVIPDPEINLNTIVERDSQTSISPPISQDSIYYRAHNTSESEGHFENVEPDIQNVMQQKDNLSRNGKDHDFFSFTQSSVNTSASHFAANEVVSSGSEKYTMPLEINELKKSMSDSPSGIKEMDEVSHLLNILCEKRTLTFDSFSEINHRLKLHLEINIFANDEQLEACLQTSIVPLSTGDEFTGLFAISSKRLYLIKFLPSYTLCMKRSEPVDKAIQIVHSSLLKHIKQICVILGSQGLTIACGPSSQVYTLVIRDADICNSFSSLLSEFIQEHPAEFGDVEFLSSADETLQMVRDSVFSSIAESDQMPEILLHLFGFWSNSLAGEEDSGIPVCIIVTPEDIFISRVLYKKQDSSPDLKNLCVHHYTPVDHQKLSDLISLKLKKDLRSVEVIFLNESSQQNSDSVLWNVKMETKSALFSFISALKSPWEGIFGVPLSLSCEEE